MLLRDLSLVLLRQLSPVLVGAVPCVLLRDLSHVVVRDLSLVLISCNEGEHAGYGVVGSVCMIAESVRLSLIHI